MTSRLSIDAATVPARCEGDSATLSLTADDRFVLDSVDGMSSVEELAMMLAMNEDSIIRSLTKLMGSQLVRIGDPSDADDPPAADAPPAEASATPSTSPSAPAKAAPPARPLTRARDEDADAHALPGRENQATADFEVKDLLERLAQQEKADSDAAASGAAAEESPGTLQIATPAAILELRDAHSGKPRFDLHSGERLDAPRTPSGAPTVPSSTVPGATVPSSTLPGATQNQRPAPPASSAPPPPASDRLSTPAQRPIPPPSSAAPPTPRRVNVDTPRTNLDQSWWGSAPKLEEPDEGLTSREISHSGLSHLQPVSSASRELRLPSPHDARLHDATPGDPDTERRRVDTPPSGVYPRQHLERPPGGFIGTRETAATSASDARETSRVDVLPAGRGAELDTAEHDALEAQDTAEHEVIAAHDTASHDTASQDADDTAAHDTVDEHNSATAPFFVDEVAHTRGDGVPLLPDARAEEGWGDVPTPIVDQSGERPWASQSVEPSLADNNGGWTSEDARAVSFYLQQLQSATYYEIFSVATDAATAEIDAAATTTRARLRLPALSAQGDAHGKQAVENVKRGMERALDVLKNPEARTQYDAALAALAAFKL